MSLTAAEWYTIENDSVLGIDQIIANNYPYLNILDWDQTDKNNFVQRNIDSINVMLLQQVVIDDSTSKTKYTNAIAAGTTYINDNS